MFDPNGESYDAYSRAAEAIARARETEGVTEGGLLRTAVVESAAALTEALFALSGAYQQFDPESLDSIAYRISDVADAIENIARTLPEPPAV